ncbi:alpha/beta hydrolase [Nocardioides sp.]|uniref:alpha/beta hydrolase n=1 Tax=Nocardioides sp. TaxID=35761 RepID=UPI003D127ADC
MAVLTCDFFSESLEMGTSMTVVLPQATESQIGVEAADGPDGAGFPVLYLLHGLSDDHSAWQRYTSIERYAAAAGLAVVMPAVGRSFYADERHGHRYWTYVAQELPALVQSFFRISTAPEDTFVAGLSMGGYGALKLALTYPERYAAAASLSGALDVVALSTLGERRALFERVFDGVVGPADDLFALLATATGSELPALHVSCGTEDPLVAANRRFVAAATEAGARVTTDFAPGAHEWGLWDRVIEDVIAWLPRETPAR